MDAITFSWDEAKGRENLRKHKVPFEGAGWSCMNFRTDCKA